MCVCCATGKSKEEAQTEYIACVLVTIPLPLLLWDPRSSMGDGTLPAVNDAHLQVRQRSRRGLTSHRILVETGCMFAGANSACLQLACSSAACRKVKELKG